MTGMIFWGIVCFLFVFAVVPTIITRLGLIVFKKGQSSHEIAFTFDDGPDPLYTPDLLDLLQKYQVKASFFVVGSKAEQYPELIARIHREGHMIGIHNYLHIANWLLTPRQVRRQIFLTADIVQRITGNRPTFYRPPWGLVNLSDIVRHKHFPVVLWSVMVGDWRSRGGTKRIKERLLKSIKGGSVIVLHDSGETFGADADAPGYMLEALENVLKETAANGYKYLRVDEMMQRREPHSASAAMKRFIVALWMKWEKFFKILFHVKPIDPDNKFLSIRLRAYHGPTIQLADGEEIRKGDRIAELHLDNELLFKLGSGARSSMQLAIQMLRATEQLLPKISHLLIANPAFRDVKGLYGISIIHRGTQKLGFTVFDLRKGIFSFLTKYYLRLLMMIIHPEGKKRLKTRSEMMMPKIIAMSTKELLARYQTDSAPANLQHSSLDGSTDAYLVKA